MTSSTPIRCPGRRAVARTIAFAVLTTAAAGTWTVTDAADDAGTRSHTRSTAAADRRSLALEATYSLRVRLLFAAGRLEVVETVDAINRAGVPLDALRLSVLARAYGEIRVRSVAVDGAPVHVTYPDRASMRVPLAQPLAPGAGLRLVIRFTDRPGPDVHDSLQARLSKAEGLLRVADWFPLLSDGHGLRNPGDSQVSASATSITLDLRTDADLVVAAPGQVLVRDGGHHVIRLEHGRDYAFVVGPHLRERTAVTRDGVRIRSFGTDGAGSRTTLALARKALERYDDAYGPYPWPELIVAPTPGGWIATESPGLVFLGRDVAERPEVVWHEIAHEWFYALMGVDQLREPWLDEALATFSETAFADRADWSYCSAKPVDSPVSAFPDAFDRWSCGGYVETVYRKGAAMVEGVRRRLGDRVFFATMRRFVAGHRFAIARGEELLSAWLAASADRDGLETYLAGFLSARAQRGMAALRAPSQALAAGAGSLR